MSTLERLETHATEIMLRVRAGERVTADEMKIVRMHTSRFSGKAGNAGKRKNPNAPKKQKS